MSVTINLKCCPFCGGRGKLQRKPMSAGEPGDMLWWSTCEDCLASTVQMKQRSAMQAAEQWNKRVSNG